MTDRRPLPAASVKGAPRLFAAGPKEGETPMGLTGLLLAPLLWLALLLLPLPACAIAGDRPVSSDQGGTPPARVAATRVTGVVTDTNGQPLAETGIAFVAATTPMPDRLWLTAEDGTYSIALPAGTFSLSANRDGYRQQVGQVTVAEGETAVLDFQLEPAP